MTIYSSGGTAVLAKGDISLQVNKFMTTIAVLKTHCVCVCASACVPVHAVHMYVYVHVSHSAHTSGYGRLDMHAHV